MRVVEYRPSMMVLASISVLAHIEPANPVRQHQNRSERRGRHHFSDPFSSDPLKSHQERELALYRGGECQGVPQKFEHRIR